MIKMEEVLVWFLCLMIQEDFALEMLKFYSSKSIKMNLGFGEL